MFSSRAVQNTNEEIGCLFSSVLTQLGRWLLAALAAFSVLCRSLGWQLWLNSKCFISTSVIVLWSSQPRECSTQRDTQRFRRITFSLYLKLSSQFQWEGEDTWKEKSPDWQLKWRKCVYGQEQVHCRQPPIKWLEGDKTSLGLKQLSIYKC